jgi:hypothetical protein
LHEPFGRKTGNLPAQQAGDFGLVNLQDARGGRLSETPCTNDSGNAKSKSGLGKTLFGIGQPKVGENIAASLFDFDCFSHAFRSFAPLQPCRARSRVGAARLGRRPLQEKIAELAAGPGRYLRP